MEHQDEKAQDWAPTDRRHFLKVAGGALGALSVAGIGGQALAAEKAEGGTAQAAAPSAPAAAAASLMRISADPTRLPPPITRKHAEEVNVVLEAKEVVAEIEPGVTFRFMTYNGQVPGPFIRVREGDTVHVTLRNPKENQEPHNADFHAVMGPGGGAGVTMARPGEQASFRFKATYPGAFIYHCAVSNMDMHISSGMFGMILVEPKEGLPTVDHEFYLGQHEIYTHMPAGVKGRHTFDIGAMVHEQPSYVVFNGAKYGFTPGRLGPMEVKTGETARVFLVVGGPNLSSSFHPIGNVWADFWPQGALSNPPLHNIQTYPVPPGSTAIATLHFPVPGPVKLVDHALSRVVHKGCLAIINASGQAQAALFEPGKVTRI